MHEGLRVVLILLTAAVLMVALAKAAVTQVLPPRGVPARTTSAPSGLSVAPTSGTDV